MRRLTLMLITAACFVVLFLAFRLAYPPVFTPRLAIVKIELETAGGPLPFSLTLLHRDGSVASLTVNNTQEVRFSQDNKTLTVHFDSYESELTLEGALPTGPLRGTWTKARGENQAVVAARSKPTSGLFDHDPNAGNPAPFAGRWSVDFGSTDDPAVGVFEVDANQIATGTFLTPTGDYRYLAGRVDGDLMRLSTFDGAHAFLFHARMHADGSITGDFWSGNWHHETWTAVRDDDAQLPDAFTQTTVANADAVDGLVFKALDGTPTKVTDLLDASGAKARIIEVFGSWCPNCADAGAEMRRLKNTFGDDLAIVGLAFERTEDFARSARQVRTYTDRFNADWPVLIAGLSDKARASAELPILDKVRAYPTTIFLNADNEIVAVHTGFNGPATGDEHTKQQAEFERIIRELIAE